MNTPESMSEQFYLGQLHRALQEINWTPLHEISPFGMRFDYVGTNTSGLLLCVETKFGTPPLHFRIAETLAEARADLAAEWPGEVVAALLTNRPVSERLRTVVASAGIHLIEVGANKPLRIAVKRLLDIAMHTSVGAIKVTERAAQAWDSGRWAEAKRLYPKILAGQEAILGVDHPITFETRLRLAVVETLNADPDRTLQSLQDLVELHIQSLESGHPRILETLSTAAHLLTEIGQEAAAVELYEDALGRQSEVLGLDHPTTLTARMNLARLLGETGRWDEARTQFEDLVPRLTLSMGLDHPTTLTARMNLARLLGETGRWEEARTEFEDLVPRLTLSMGLDHPDTPGMRADMTRIVDGLAAGNRLAHLPDLAGSLSNLAAFLGAAGRRDEALAAAERAVAVREELAEANRAACLPDLAVSVSNLAAFLAAAGRRDEALAAAERAVAIREELVETDRAAYLPDLAMSVSNLAVNLAAAGRRDEALAAAERAVAMCEELAEANRAAYLPDLATSVHNLAVRLSEAGRQAEALAAAERAVAMREELAEGNRATYLPDLARSVWMAAYVRHALGIELDAALDCCDRAIGYFRELSEAEPDVFNDDLAAVQALRQTLIEHRDEPT